MANRRNSAHRSGRVARLMSNRAVVSGSYLYSTTVAATTPSSTLVGPGLIPRTTAIAAAYQNYRYLDFKIHMLPLSHVSTVDNYWVLGTSSDVSATNSLTSAAQLSECTPSGVQGNSTVSTTNTSAYYPRSVVHLRQRDLLADVSLKWFKCSGDSDTNSWENFQFQLLFYNDSSSSATFQLWIDYTIEFEGAINTLLTRVLPTHDPAEQGHSTTTVQKVPITGRVGVENPPGQPPPDSGKGWFRG